MMEKILPSTKTKMRILEYIYRNPGVSISEIIKKTGASPNTVVDYVDMLVESDVLSENRVGGEKKTHIRLVSPKYDSNLSVQMFSMVEIDKRNNFFEKYKNLKPIIEQLSDLLKNHADFALVYGSYARFAAERDSDLDILVVGNISNQLKEKVSEVFVTFDKELSTKIETLEKFKERIGDPLHQNIASDHVVALGEMNCVKEMFSAKT